MNFFISRFESHFSPLGTQNLLYYDIDQNKKPIHFDGPSVHQALEALEAGQLKAKHSENVVERTLRVGNHALVEELY